MNVIKRSGDKQPLDVDKINKVAEWACEGIDGVSASEVVLEAQPQFVNNIKTEDIHAIIVDGAANLIPKNTNYQFVAARLAIFDIYKKVYGSHVPKHIYEVVKENVELGVYDPALLQWYTEEEWNSINNLIRHKRDWNFSYAAVVQIADKYLVQDRKTRKLYESPQIMFILIPCVAFKDRPDRMRLIKEAYNLLSTFKISLPTPILAGLRTSTRQLSSCVLVDIGDNLNSINAGSEAINRYASKRAGLGINAGRIRAVGSRVGKGEIVHTGITPFLRQFESALKSVSQGGIRDASATVSAPVWHYEIEDILVLKNNKGTHETRVRRLDYAIAWDKFLLRKAVRNETMSLFSPNDVPDLYEAYYKKDREEFESLYAKYELKKNLRKKVVNARDILTSFVKESQETGRVYLFMADNVNQQSVFNIPIYMTNLCCATGDTNVSIYDPEQPETIQTVSIEDLFLDNKWSNYSIVCNKIEDGDFDFQCLKPIKNVSLTKLNGKLVKITTKSGFNLTCTHDHLVYSREYGYIQADKLSENETVHINDTICFWDQIVSVENLGNSEQSLYDIEVEDYNNFYANNILVHNCEITLPTEPIRNKVTVIDEDSGLIDFQGLVQLCTLGAINLGNINLDDTSDMESRMSILVNLLNEVLDYQDYVVPQARKATMAYRPLGIGVINYAYFLAKNGLKYSDKESHNLTHRLAEQMYYFALKASVELAKERGKMLPAINHTIYAEAKTLLDVYCKEVDNIVDEKLHMDWKSLIQDLGKFGIYNSTLLALMPSESSSVVSDATNGVEPIRSVVTNKQNKNRKIVQVAPDYKKVKYDFLWSMSPEDFEGYIRNMAVFQKFICQAISANFSYNPQFFEGEKLSLGTLINHHLLAAKLGLKTRYYVNTKGLEAEKDVDLASQEEYDNQDGGCAGGACKI